MGLFFCLKISVTVGPSECTPFSSMQQIKITPVPDYELPKNEAEEYAPSLQENARVAANTAELMFELGMPFEMTEEDHAAAAKLFGEVDKKRKKGQNTVKIEEVNPPALYQGNVALKLGSLLREYDHRVILDATQARTYIMNRLLELSSCGDSKAELRALELMGKMSDIGAFTEKSEVTITHRSAGDIKEVLKEKLAKLLVPDVVDAEIKDIKKELGVDTDVEDVETSGSEEEKDPVDVELDALAAERRLQRSEFEQKIAEKAAQNEEETAKNEGETPE